MRQDAWQEQDDLVLAETVLNHIRSGSTQLVAFEEVAKKLHRTPAACGFRWNSDVRKRYEKEIIEAKAIRKDSRKKSKNTVSEPLVVISKKAERELEVDYAEQIIQASKHLQLQNKKLVERIRSLSEELQQARQEVETLKGKMVTETPETVASEDYQALIKILSRARNLGVLEKFGSVK